MQKIYEKRDKQLHPPKEEETIYKGFMSLLLKVVLKQFEETINLADTPIESMNHSATVRESTSINLHRTGSKDGYEPADNSQLSSKNLDCQSKSDENTENNFVKTIKDDKSSSVSTQSIIQPKINSIRCIEADNQVDTPILFMNLLVAVQEFKNINLHKT
jgi:hypothetical protein